MSPRWALCALLVATPATRGADEPKETVTVIKLTVTPRPAPTPALKYLLFPDLKDMRSGNAVQAYYKCFLEQNQLYYGKEATADREKWLNSPLSELPDKLADYGGASARQADYAARLEACDWQILDRLREHGISLLLPDIQPLRMLAAVLKVRYRGQIKVGKFDEAIQTHQTMFALARHLGEHPTLIGHLVGIAIANIAVGPLEEMIQQPGCPNLYWALAHLPRPFIDLRRSLAGERMFIFNAGDWGGPLVDPGRVWGEDDTRRAVDVARRFRSLLDQPKKGEVERIEKWITEKMKDENWVAAARKSLTDYGFTEERVKKYPPGQVLFHYLRTRYEISRDDAMKWAVLPFWQADPELANLAKQPENPTAEQLIMSTILPAMHKVPRASARFDQRLALLTVAEALRLHAAENNGKFPGSLADVKVPLPLDPINGKPFTYRREGDTAVIQGAAPKGEEKNPHYNLRYELTVRK